MSYQIIDWDKHYENNRSRQVERLQWVSVPNRHDGEGYSIIMADIRAAEIFAAWILMIQVASKCKTRGSLVRDDGTPMSLRAISLKTRGDLKWFEYAIPKLLEVGWIQPLTSCCDHGAPERQASDAQVTPSCEERREENGKKEENHNFDQDDSRLDFDLEESQKPKRSKKTAPLTWNNQTGWVGLTPEIVVALNAINPGVDLEQEMAHANAWLIGQGKPHSPRAMSFLSNWLKKAKPAPEVVTIEFQRAETADMGWEDFMRLTWDGDQEELEDLIQNRKELNEEAKQS